MRNISITKGVNAEFVFPFVDDNGDAIDNTGYHYKLQVRKEYEDSPALITKTQTDGIDVGGADGLATVAFLPADTSELIHGRYIYDMFYKDLSGAVKKLDGGYFTIEPAVTIDIS